MLIVVQPVADHKFVGNGKAHILRLQGDTGFPALRLIQQCADPQGGRLLVQKVVYGVRQRGAGIKDILQDHHMAALDIHGYVFSDLRSAGGGGSAVRGDIHKIDLAGDVNIADHIRKENYHAFQHTDENRVLAIILTADLVGQFFHLGLNLFFGQQNLFDIIFHSCLLSHFLYFSAQADRVRVPK